MTTTKISTMKGDATCPQGPGTKIIVHIVNDSGKWGKGFVMALSKKWPALRDEYLGWYNGYFKDVCEDYVPFELGRVQFLSARPDIMVANMLAQRGVIGRSNPTPIRYDALRNCLKSVAQTADHLLQKGKKPSIHMPRIGCGLGGGKWEKIEPIIKEELCSKGIPVTVYEHLS